MSEAVSNSISDQEAISRTLKLRDVFSGAVSRLVEVTPHGSYTEAAEAAKHIDIHPIPAGTPYLHIPPLAFLYKDIPNRDRDDPEDYERKVFDAVRSTDDMLYVHIDNIINSPDFNENEWRSYEAYVETLLFDRRKDEEYLHIHDLRKMRKRHARVVDGSEEYAKKFLYAFNPALKKLGYLQGETVVPVGEYSEDFALKIMKTTLALQTAYTKELLTEYFSESESAIDQVKEHMARYYLDHPKSIVDAAIATFYEGLTTVSQTLTLMTSRKVAGYDDPIALAQAVVRAGIVERFARITPPGKIGPMNLAGAGYPSPVITNPDGGVMLNPALYTDLKRQRMQYLAAEHPRNNLLKKTCPVSNEGGAIRQMADVFVTHLERVNTMV